MSQSEGKTLHSWAAIYIRKNLFINQHAFTKNLALTNTDRYVVDCWSVLSYHLDHKIIGN